MIVRTSLAATSLAAKSSALLMPRVQTPQSTRNSQPATASSVVTLGNGTSLSAVYSLNAKKSVNTAGLISSQLSTLLDTNVRASSADAFQGVGKALLTRLTDNPQDVTLASVSGAQASDGTRAQDRAVALSITTQSGVNVNIGMTRNANGLVVELKTTGGELSEEETAAIAALGDAFQSALDGLAQKAPALNVSGLTAFDSTLLKSVDLQTDVREEATSIQSLSYRADSTQRALSYKTSDVSFAITTDLSHPETIGSYGQQQAALANWTSQLNSARSRGQGDRDLVELFKQSFLAVNSQYGSNEADTSHNIITRTNDNATQQQLSGLADYSATFTQTEKSTNPYRKDERDAFSYSTAQTTERQNSRSLTQKITTQLQASYHEALDKTIPLNLTSDPLSQNYLYHQINDETTRETQLAYNDKGEIKSVRTSTDTHDSEIVKKYNAARLVDETHTPYDNHTSKLTMMIIDSISMDPDSGQARVR